MEAEAHGKLGPVWNESLLIVDDAHDLSLEHLMFIKEITDQGRLQYDHPLGGASLLLDVGTRST